MATANGINLNAFKEKAEAGDADAQYEMAFIENEYADPIMDSGKRSLTWLEKAANQGHSDAQLAMGLYFLFKIERKLLMKKWRNHLNDNITRMPLCLGVYLAIAALFEANNDHLAFEWLKKSSTLSNSDGQFWLGYCYYNGLGIEQNNEAAFAEFSKAAKQNMPDAMYWLARCYFEGIGVLNNDSLAFDWLVKAVENSCDDGYLMLGDLYRQGKYVEQDAKLAFQWYEKAAIRNNAFAQHKLGQLYMRGEGVLEDVNKALEWEEKAAENGNQDAKDLQINTFLGIGIGYATGEHDGKKYQINLELAFVCFQKAASYGSVDAYFLIGNCYERGKGVEQNDKLAFEYYQKVLNSEQYQVLPEYIRSAAQVAISRYYQEGKIVEKDEILAKQHLDNVNKEVLGDLLFDGFMHCPADSPEAKVILPIRLKIHNSLADFDKARDFVDGVFTEGKNEQNYKEICHQLINAREELEKKNRQLEEKNRCLMEAEKELEDLMAMFAHKFRSPLDAIIYNAEHEHQEKLYRQAAQTMRGLLDIFSIASTDADTLQDRLKQDRQGSGNLTNVFGKTLDMVLLHLLSASASEKIQQHYLCYAKTHGLCDGEVNDSQWNEDYFELERRLQSEWEHSYAQLLSQSAPLEQRLSWLEQHFFKLELRGFERADIQFREYGITESLLTILLNELLVNVFKYYASEELVPVVVEWSENGGYQILSCRNPSTRNERNKIKGSGKGHSFLSALSRKIGCEFKKPKPADDFVVEFVLADELLISS